jgi:glycosyltransferase involved in cell wall biosynthesis
MRGLSVIICCYNSVPRIKPTLEHLKNQKVTNEVDWEIVLVDNNSTDNTASFALQIWKDQKIPLRVINESRAGQGYARATGAKKATYDYIIFCDDDNWLCSTYIQTVFAVLDKHNDIGAVGGQSKPAFADRQDVPEWFSEKQQSYATGKQANETGDITSRLFLWGAGIGLRKNAYLKAFEPQWPSLLVGRVGEQLSSGDDTELCMRLVVMGYKLYYDERLFYYHFIPANRLSLAYITNLEESFKKTYGIQTLYSELIHNFILVNNVNLRHIFKTICQELVEKNFHFQKTRRYMYWKWGFPPINNKAQRLLRNFYLANGNSINTLRNK